MFDKISKLEVGQSLQWHNAPLSSGMIADSINRDGKSFEVRWITTNWEASEGYLLITRHESIPSRFTDPAYAKAERKVARVERSIRRNVR